MESCCALGTAAFDIKNPDRKEKEEHHERDFDRIGGY